MFPDDDRHRWFAAHTKAVLDRCRRVIPGSAKVVGLERQPFHVYVPSGDDAFPSFFVRDASMQARSGLISATDLFNMLRVVLHHQNGPEILPLVHGQRIDPWAIPDHINLPGLGSEEFRQRVPVGPIFFPGTYLPGENQGEGMFGIRPADDNIYELIELTRVLVDRLSPGKGRLLLLQPIRGATIVDMLRRGFESMIVDPNTDLCWNSPDDWAGASLHNGLKHMGAVAISSVLRCRAARTLVRFYEMLQSPTHPTYYREMADRLARAIEANLLLPEGWLKCGSRVDRLPDVFATALAVYEEILSEDARRAAIKVMIEAARDGVTVQACGYLRHIPRGLDAHPGHSIWEGSAAYGQGEYGTYQNGGYWAQPLGWYIAAIAEAAPELARTMACQFIDHTRQYAEQGAPFEWMNPDISVEQMTGSARWYGAAAALNLAAFTRLSREEEIPLA